MEPVVLAFTALITFLFVASAAYVGTLWALEVYFDRDRDSFFLSTSHDPPTNADDAH